MDNNNNMEFEDNLRQILSPGPVTSNGSGVASDSSEPAPVRRAPLTASQKFNDAADKYKSNQKQLFWFKMLRPIAVVALVGLLALFVFRVFNQT